MTTNAIKAVLWDMDGTLADSEPLHLRTLLAVLARHGIEAGDELHRLIFGKTGREVHSLCQQKFGIVTLFDEWALLRASHYLDEAATIAPRAGALAVFRAVKAAGLAQAIVSNSSRMLLEANLRALGLQDPQLVSVSANDVREGKPDPEPYLRAAWLLRIAPDEAVVVEDSPTGARAAVAAEMRVIAWPLSREAADAFPARTQCVFSADELAHALGVGGVHAS